LDAYLVILHTGFAHTAIMKRAMEFSPFTVLAKPCRLKQLVETIRSLQPLKLTRTKAAGGPSFARDEQGTSRFLKCPRT
jgi:hypothetical protein